MLSTGLSNVHLITLAVAAFLAATVRGYAGFGLSALFVASASFILPVSQIVPIALMLEMAASVHMLPSVWRLIDWKMYLLILLGCLLATPLGVYVLAVMPVLPARVTVYGLIALVCFLIWRGHRLASTGNGVWVSTGVIAGFLNGVAGIGGLGMMLMFLSTHVNPMVARATMIGMFLALNLYTCAVGYSHGLIDEQTFRRFLVLLPPMICGVAIGQWRFARTQPESFRKMALALLFGLSVLGLLRTVLF